MILWQNRAVLLQNQSSFYYFELSKQIHSGDTALIKTFRFIGFGIIQKTN